VLEMLKNLLVFITKAIFALPGLEALILTKDSTKHWLSLP